MNNKEMNKSNGIRTINYANLQEVITKDQLDRIKKIENTKRNNQKEALRRKALRAKNKEEDRIELQQVKFIESNNSAIHKNITLKNE